VSLSFHGVVLSAGSVRLQNFGIKNIIPSRFYPLSNFPHGGKVLRRGRKRTFSTAPWKGGVNLEQTGKIILRKCCHNCEELQGRQEMRNTAGLGIHIFYFKLPS